MVVFPDGFAYHASVFTALEQSVLVAHLRGLPFTHDPFRGQRLRRGYAQFGYAYVSAGKKVRPAGAFPEFLAALVERVMPHCPPQSVFHQCLITHYPANAGIGWHTDASLFGDTIVGISLGGDARFQLRPTAVSKATHELTASPGSLYTMSGAARWHYEHRVVPVENERYSITLRKIAGI